MQLTRFSIVFAAAILGAAIVGCNRKSGESSAEVRTSKNSTAAQISFNRDIRPILSENCYACHGPDKNARKADLRLDEEKSAFAKLESGDFAIVPGDLQKSLLIERVTAKDSDVMPPPKTGKHLTEQQISLLKNWVKQGAKWEAHWAYIQPVRSAPAVADRKWARNAIDTFVLARLQQEGFRPSGEADRVTLIRRLSFDLTGLPPKSADVDAFINDKSKDAYEKVVERLLASPEYGERMAVYWLDLVRFADSAGYHSDNPKNVFPYRDYVINSFNANKPFDVFTTEQLAGDLIPNATLTQKIGSGYNRLLMTTEEGGAQAKEYRAKYFADRVRNVSSVWMGSTMGCCECHDHKFDPFSTRDFYQMAAFFADIREAEIGRREPGIMVPNAEQTAALAKFDARIGELRTQLAASTPELEAAQVSWEQSKKSARTYDWKTLVPASATSDGKATLKIDKDGVVTASGTNPAKDTHKLVVKTKLKGITAFRIEALPEKSLPKSGPGRADNGNFVLTEFSVEQEVGGSPTAIALQNASESFAQNFAGEGSPYKKWTAEGAIDGDAKGDRWGWATMEQAGRENHAVFETKDAAGAKDDAEVTLTFTLKHSHGDKHTLGRYRISATSDARPVRAAGADDPPKEIIPILAVAPEKRNDQQKKAIATHFRSITPLLKATRDELANQEKKKAELEKSIPTCLISVAETPKQVRVLARGNWMDDSGELVAPGVPHFLPQIKIKVADNNPAAPRATRLDLANWMTDRENPLTSRVFVNRLWKLFFGQGISNKLDDLGAQGEWPTHPELLDWMAVEFVDNKWDVKHMVRLLVTSSAYRQSSKAGPQLRERDPYNRLYAHQSAFRLDAEFVRDNALAISGLLVQKIGGQSVYPYQPKGYWQHMNFPTREWQNDKGEGAYRRGLYTWWQRTFPQPSMLAFDAPSREECCVERPRSNTPQQALVLLNDPTYVEAARVFAARIIKEGGASFEQRLTWAFRAAVSHAPDATQIQVLRDLYTKHRDQFNADKKAAEQLPTVGETPAPKEIDPAELAAWTSVARTILNLHETLTRN